MTLMTQRSSLSFKRPCAVKLMSQNSRVKWPWSLHYIAWRDCIVFYCIAEVFCTSETFNAVCDPGHVIVVRRAFYGRLSASRCITSEYAHALGCYADVTSHVIDACSGAGWRQNCSLLVATVDAIAQPCGKDFKSYLDIEYDCALGNNNNVLKKI